MTSLVTARFPLSTPDELAEAPELAALHILASAAEISRRALLAAHPELIDRSFLAEEAEISARQCLAAAIVIALENVGEPADTYCAHLDHLAARSRTQDRDDIAS